MLVFSADLSKSDLRDWNWIRSFKKWSVLRKGLSTFPISSMEGKKGKKYSDWFEATLPFLLDTKSVVPFHLTTDWVKTLCILRLSDTFVFTKFFCLLCSFIHL